METRKFKCASCGYEFEVPFGSGAAGKGMTCPKCGSTVHRIGAGDMGSQSRGFGSRYGRRGNGPSDG